MIKLVCGSVLPDARVVCRWRTTGSDFLSGLYVFALWTVICCPDCDTIQLPLPSLALGLIWIGVVFLLRLTSDSHGLARRSLDGTSMIGLLICAVLSGRRQRNFYVFPVQPCTGSLHFSSGGCRKWWSIRSISLIQPLPFSPPLPLSPKCLSYAGFLTNKVSDFLCDQYRQFRLTACLTRRTSFFLSYPLFSYA